MNKIQKQQIYFNFVFFYLDYKYEIGHERISGSSERGINI